MDHASLALSWTLDKDHGYQATALHSMPVYSLTFNGTH